MSEPSRPGVACLGLVLFIDQNRSPAQAMAVIEVLNDLRDRIWAHYELALYTHYRDDRITQCDPPVTDPPF